MRSTIALGALLLSVVAVVVWLGLGSLPSAVPTGPAPAASRPDDATSAVAPTSSARPGAPASTPRPAAPASAAPTSPRRPRLVVAWQPSHQDDTGPGPWHEYVICNDIVERVSKLLPDIESVKAWDIAHGLYGSNNYPKPVNTPAFDKEVGIANASGADVFVSIHNDSEAPSGVLGEYMPGDVAGEALCKSLVDAISARTGLHDRGLRDVRLYSLDPSRNRAPTRCLLEIGDNVHDRAFLEDPDERQLVAEALAGVIGQLPASRE